MTTNWRIYKSHTVAALLDRSEIPGLIRKKIVVGPTDGAIVLRDGVPVDFFSSNSMQVADLADQVKSVFGLGKDLSVYFVELAAFELTLFIGASTTAAVASNSVAFDASNDTTESSTDANRSFKSREKRGDSQRKGKRRSKEFFDAAESMGWQQESQHLEQTQVGTVSQSDVSRVHIVALSADGEVMQGVCRVRVFLDPERWQDFVGLLKGKKGLATWDLAALFRDEIFSKVLVPEIAAHPASEFRGNRELQADLEAQVREELSDTLTGCGLVVENFTINWGLTEQERADISRRRMEREEAAMEFAKKRRLSQMQREHQVEQTRIANLQELKTAQVQGDEDLKTLLLESDLKRDLLVKNQQVDNALVDARIRDITLEVEKKESIARLEERRANDEYRLEIEDREFRQSHDQRLANIEADDKEMWSMVKMQVEMATQKHEREIAKRRQEIDADARKTQAEIEDRYQQRKLKLDESLARMGMMERLVSQGLQGGQADASVLKTMLEQSTEMEYATTTDSKVQSRSTANAASNQLETYRQAQADERAHQVDMTNLSANMMSAAKQNPSILVPPTSTPAPPNQPVVNVHAATSSGSATSACRNCGEALQSNWKACPACATPVALPGCPGCSAEVQPHWKACPECGQQLGVSASRPTCSHCHSAVEPNWQACPECGKRI